MQTHPTFPFFEVPAVARSAYPLLDPFTAPSTQRRSTRNYINFASARSLGGMIDGIRSGHLQEIGIPTKGFCADTYRTHKEIYERLATFGKRYVPESFSIDDHDAEKNAFSVATTLGEQLAEKSLSLPANDVAFSKHPLYLRAVFSSVWVEHPEPEGIPYVLDQLWVVERECNKNDCRSFYLLGVEIDGSTKWDRDTTSQYNDNLTKQTIRSQYLLKQGIGLYRIGAVHMSNKSRPEDRLVQMHSLSARLCEYETLRRKDIIPDIVTADFNTPDYRALLASKNS